MTPGARPEGARPHPRRAALSWAFFDWAHSSFSTLIITFVFAAYFTRAVAVDPTRGTTQWGYALSASALVVAVSAPVLGAIADQWGRLKPWLGAGAAIGALATALLWFVEPDPADALLALALVALANASFELGWVFYNAMLPGLGPRERIGRLSGWGWGLGYAGGLSALGLALVFFIQPEEAPFGLDRGRAEDVRAVGPMVAVWFLVFALPLFLWTPDRARTGRPLGGVVRRGLRELGATVRSLRRFAGIGRFLLARLFYIDGLNTLFAFGGVYAAGTFDMTIDQILVFGMTLNLSAGLGAATFGWVDDRIGAGRTVLLALASLAVTLLVLLLVRSQTLFWVFGTLLGVFVGPIQASSRSYMARAAPPGMQSEMFGLFALSGKITAFMGPALVAWVTSVTASQRAGMAVILVLLGLGGILLYGVRDVPEALAPVELDPS